MNNQSTIRKSLKIKAWTLAIVGLISSAFWAYVFVYNLSEGTALAGLVVAALSVVAYLVPSIMLFIVKTTQHIKVLAIILGIVAALGLAISLSSGNNGGLTYIVVVILAVVVNYDTTQHSTNTE